MATWPWSLDLMDTSVGSVCFSKKQQSNKKMRALFQKDIVTIPYIMLYWDGIVANIPWRKVWSLPLKYLLSNKVREVALKLIHRIYPSNVFLMRYKADIETDCSFSKNMSENRRQLFISFPMYLY